MATIEVHIHQVGPSTSEAKMRGHVALVDRPLGKGGADAGPMGGEYFLTAVGGCFMSTLLAAIRARSAPISGVCTKVTGTLADSPSRYTSIELEVSAEHDHGEELAHLVEVAREGCIMVQTLRSGLTLQVRTKRMAERLAGEPSDSGGRT